jgi:phosphoglycerate dehydrogenase-like enzyme
MLKPKIVVVSPRDLSSDQKTRLEHLGETIIYDTLPETPDIWMKRTEKADIICSGKYGLTEKIYDRKNVFYSLPFVAIDWIDKKRLKDNGNTVSYCPGCNSHAVSEWIVTMALLLFRRINYIVNKQKQDSNGLLVSVGFSGKKGCILGKGNIGSKAGKILESFGMKVEYFSRGDNIFEKINNSDVVINTLSCNETTIGLLNKQFFDSFKGKTCFITVSSSKIYDYEAMLSALENGKLAGIADDCASILPGNFDDPYYQKLINIPKVLATPHIAYLSDVSTKLTNDMMIDNVEAWIGGKPINLLI